MVEPLNFMATRCLGSQELGQTLNATTQVDRLKAEGFQGQTLRDHPRLRAFELAIESKVDGLVKGIFTA
jgi:hypothetical protein